MKKAKKILALLLCAILLVGATIAGTVAYLTDIDNNVENTFTVGKVIITLDEAKVDEYGAKYYKQDGVDADNNPVYVETDAANAARVTANTYKLVPGQSYAKDPTVHVDASSETCYIFVKVVNEIEGIEADTKIAAQIAANGWTSLDGVAGVYYKLWNKGDNADLTVFSSFTIIDSVEATTLDTYAGKTIEVTAYAIQEAGMADAAAAWDAGDFE